MKSKKPVSPKKTYAVFTYLGWAFGVGSAICFGLIILSAALFWSKHADSNPGNWIGFYVAVIFMIAFLILTSVFYYLRSRMKAEQKGSEVYFSKPIFVYSESYFAKEVHRLSGESKKSQGEGIVAAINIKGLNGDLLNFYGEEEVKAINTIVFETISARFDDRKKYRYGFSTLNSFLLYTRSVDAESFENELKLLAHQIESKVAARGRISSLTILFGSCSLKNGKDVPECLSHALFASRYNAMNRFSSAVVPFSSDQMSASDNERELPADIIKAIKEEQFQIFYQPKFNLHSNTFYGAEALVRWNHPTRGLLPPSFFIPFSERTGLIVDLDHYIYEHSLRDLAKWENDGGRLVKLSINLSRRTVYDEGLLEFLTSTAEKYGVESKWLDIELTESLAARDAAFLYQLVSKIKGANMATSIDDFGVGYSSFNSLKKLPFDTLKIDKSFIDDIEVDQKSCDIVNAIISLAHSLGIWTIAEGVETQKQVDILKSMGLDAVQGYYYSHPLNSFEFQRFLKNNNFEGKGEKK